jgi:bifunctional DNase/RNase
MIAMNIEGVRRNFWRSDLYIVSLVDEMGQRLLNIAIGQQEAYVIAMALHQLDSPRPMTLHFMANAFRALNVVLEEVRIEQLQRSPLPFFYAVAQLRNGETMQELDVRPSDALGLAVLLGSPISVSEQLLEDVGVILPEGKTPELYYAEQLLKHEGITLPEGKMLRLGYSKVPACDAVVKEIKATLSGIPQLPGEKEFEQARKNYLRFVLGDDFEL